MSTTPPPTSVDTPTGRLSLYTIGTGPSMLILHGSASTGETHLALAHLLSAEYTVHLYSRRSRGLSTPYPPSITSLAVLSTASDPPIQNGHRTAPRSYNAAFSAAVLEADVSDLEIMIEKTGAEYVIGVSTGALIILSYLLSRRDGPQIKKAVLFEPPIFFSDHSDPVFPDSLPRFEDEWEAGDTVNAMITAMKTVKLGPWWIPRFVARGIIGVVGKKAEEGMKEMGRSLRYDFAVVEGMVGTAERFRHITGIEVLLLGGERSPGYLRKGLEVLAQVVRNRVVLEGVGHEVLCGKEMRGCPERALGVIMRFFE